MSRSRAWCFTINNPSDEERKLCDEVQCNYIVYGNEVGENGTPHLQGYIEFKDGKSLSSVKKTLGNRVHLESRKGTPRQASDYCKKEGNFVERGTISNQGKRSDLDDVVEALQKGGIEQVVKDHPKSFIKYGRNIERLCELTMGPRDINKPPLVYWLWGKTGVGKTRFAQDTDKSRYTWNGTKWWNGYRQQHRIIIDDYTPSEGDGHFRYMLRILDRYPIQVETKGGMVYLNSQEIFITCEHPPESFWSDNALAQILRRIKRVIHLDPDNEPALYQCLRIYYDMDRPCEEITEDNVSTCSEFSDADKIQCFAD